MSLPSISVLIPCFNEEVAITKVIGDFRRMLPDARIFVFDNNSTDQTAEVAAAAGAEVRSVSLRGKGNVVRRMFADVESDIYILVDGDDTYDANAVTVLIERLVTRNLDMVVGSRKSDDANSYRSGHRFGNRLLTSCVAGLFGRSFGDMLSGYRVFSRRFVKSFPAHSKGFEIETELNVHALSMRLPCDEIATRYSARPEGSASKLNTYRDGIRILWMIGKLFKNEKPLLFFTLGFAFCLTLSVVIAWPLLITFFATGLVPRLPTAVLCAALALLSFIFLICGLVLDTVTQGRVESKRFAYLRLPAQNFQLRAQRTEQISE